MAGTERIGYEYSFASLLKDCYYILTPTSQVPERSIRWMQEFVQNVTRSRCVTIDVTQHDEATAGISHAPHIISAALVNAVRARDDKGMYQLLAAGGFRDITRISSSSPEMWTSICLANKDAILGFLKEYGELLGSMEHAIEQGNESEINNFFATAKEYRDKLFSSEPSSNQ